LAAATTATIVLNFAVSVDAVRDSDHDRQVTGLSYSAHPSAVGDLAVVVAVSCPHRAEALDACRALIDELKETVPIWKHQRFADGASEWVGSTCP
jgi:molybdopterin synthase catalytic subunit